MSPLTLIGLKLALALLKDLEPLVQSLPVSATAKSSIALVLQFLESLIQEVENLAKPPQISG